jgi:hypothetical protein
MMARRFWQSEARATSNGAKPKYPDSRFFNSASVSERGTGRHALCLPDEQHNPTLC